LLTKDDNGMNVLDKFLAAVVNNTEDSLENTLRQWRSLGKTCAAEIVGGAVVGAASGCAGGAVTGAIAGAGVGALPGCAVGAAGGLVAGFVGGIGACAITAIVDSCIASTSNIETAVGLKKVSELEIGDYVKTSSDGYSTHFTEFLGWMDRHISQPSHMLNIWTSNGQFPLTLSKSHVVFTTTTTKYAGDIQPGDCLLHWNGTSMKEMEVEGISPTISNGYWAPLTRAGHLLVDGYLTSCYASYPHKLADVAMTPIKAAPTILLDDHESQHKDGVRKVINFIKSLGNFIGSRKLNDIPGKLPTMNAAFVNSFSMKFEF